jgi:hypothetical protein
MGPTSPGPGGEFALTARPHRRTCGSAYGGSTNTLESLLIASGLDTQFVREFSNAPC